MGRPRQVSDEQIIEAARRCFLSNGVHVTVQAIADEIGVSHAAIFSRFGTKEALMIASLGPPQELPFAAALRAGPHAYDGRVQLGEIGRLLIGYFERLGSGWALLQAAGIGLDKVFAGHARPTPLDAHDLLRAWLGRARRRGLIGPCDLDVLTWTFLGGLHHRVFRSAPPNTGVPRATGKDVDALVDTLWQGIAPAPPRFGQRGLARSPQAVARAQPMKPARSSSTARRR